MKDKKDRIAPYPNGIALVNVGSMEKKAKAAVETNEELKKDLSKIGKLKLFFTTGEAGEMVKIVKKRAKALTKANELSKEFRMVRLDTSIKRKVVVTERWTEREIELPVPFIFSSRLPAKSKTSYTITVGRKSDEDQPRRGRMRFRFSRRRGQSKYKVTSVTPIPQDAALEALQKHASKFDYTEVWWVPKDINVKEIKPPVPDPIVVGVVEAPRKNREPERFCFELYRWEEPDLENPYFAHEAY